jgi:mRNA interferase RelE/StbE
MAWRIEFSPLAAKYLEKIDRQAARRILTFLHERVVGLADPRTIGEALKGLKLGSFWKYRVGDYRIVANIDHGAVRIIVVRSGDRSEIYR